MLNRNYLYTLGIVFLLLAASAAHANSRNASYPKTRMGVLSAAYSGEEGRSFAESSPAMGLTLNVSSEAKHFSPFVGLKLITVSGDQTFLDGTTEIESKFVYSSASVELGVHLYPLERRSRGINVYVSGGASLGYNYLALDKDTEVTDIPKSDQVFSAGYVAGFGFEWILSEAGRDRWSLFGEAMAVTESTTLLEKTYKLDRMILAVGLSW